VHRHVRKVCPRTTGSREKIGTDDLPNMVAALQTTEEDATTKSFIRQLMGYVWYNIRGATASVIILAKCADNYYVYGDGFCTDQGTLTEGESSVRLTSSFRNFFLR
jgi:hypothetical protein